ncbi:MAG: hypothetical protein ACO387_03490 [Flavobacteriaceae bacterium]
MAILVAVITYDDWKGCLKDNNIADLNKDGKIDDVDLDIAKSDLKDAAKKVNAVLGVKKDNV